MRSDCLLFTLYVEMHSYRVAQQSNTVRSSADRHDRVVTSERVLLQSAGAMLQMGWCFVQQLRM